MNTATSITVNGTGFNANTFGYVWFDTDGDKTRDTGEPQVSVTTTGAGDIPSGTALTTPLLPPNTKYYVWADIPSGVQLEGTAEFITNTVTTALTVNLYDAYGYVLNTSTVDYEWMESNLPIYGNSTTRYYSQGPTFNSTDFDAIWNPAEDINVESRDYGRPEGTDVKDLCNVVGGASPGDTIQIKASDNFNKWFDYEDIYDPEPEQGKLVICWYNADYGGYVPTYDTGMRLLFFADTSVNQNGWHAFGDWDMHENLPESRWHYYSENSIVFWPSSSGLSVQNVYYINIYQPNLVSCDASGNPQDSFAPGDTVYVKGINMAINTSYKLWIQPEPVSNNKLSIVPGVNPGLLPAYVFNTSNDPSGSQETVTTDANGDFGPTAIWSVDSSASEDEYDIVADSQSSGTVGTYDSYDYIDNPGWKGFAIVTPSEFISFTVTDYNGDGINFGNLDPGQSDQPADGQPSQGAVTITVGTETNVDVNVSVMGTDFAASGNIITIDKVKYNDENNTSGASVLTTSYTTWYTVDVPLASANVTQAYYWITIPAGQPAGDYTSTFSYKAEKASP